MEEQTMTMSKEVKDEVKMYVASGWDIKEETPELVLLKRNESSIGGHLLVLLFLGWWTFGIANLIYHLVMIQRKKILK